MPRKKAIRTSLLLALILLVPLFSIPLVWGAGPSFDNGGIQTNCADAWTTCATTISSTNGEEIIAFVNTRSCSCGIPAVTMADSAGNVYTLVVTAGSSSAGWMNVFKAPVTASSTNDVVTASTSGSSQQSMLFAVEYKGVTGVGASTSGTFAYTTTTTTSLSLTTTATVSTAIEMISDLNGGGSGACTSFTGANGQTARGSLSCSTNNAFNDGLGGQFFDLGNLSPATYPMGISVSAISGTANGVHFVLELQGSGSPGGGVSSVTQCYGNCGNPGITLANTNSTHSVNFNQSITLFYPFVSQLNGFFVNATTNVAKTYVNGQTVFIGLYVAASTCPLGSTPFTANCPGLLISSTSFVNPSKGKLTLTVSSGSGGIANGQNGAVAVSCLFSPCDLNDTNTNVAISQTNGIMPSTIAQSSTFSSCPCKTGLWTFIIGNIITGVPPPGTVNGSCFGLDCILAAVVNSSCQVVTTACQTGSALFWIIILSVITIAITLVSFSYAFPSISVSTKGIGELGILIFIAWFAVFGSFGLILPWLIILMFFVVAWLFLGRARGTGPI